MECTSHVEVIEGERGRLHRPSFKRFQAYACGRPVRGNPEARIYRPCENRETLVARRSLDEIVESNGALVHVHFEAALIEEKTNFATLLIAHIRSGTPDRERSSLDRYSQRRFAGSRHFKSECREVAARELRLNFGGVGNAVERQGALGQLHTRQGFWIAAQGAERRRDLLAQESVGSDGKGARQSHHTVPAAALGCICAAPKPKERPTFIVARDITRVCGACVENAVG